MNKRFLLGALGGLLWLAGCRVRDEIARGRSDSGGGAAVGGEGVTGGAGGSSTATGGGGPEPCSDICPWSTTLGAPWTRPLGLAVAPDGSVALATENFTPIQFNDDLVLGTRITRLDPAGHVVWDMEVPWTNGVAFDDQGNLFVGVHVRSGPGLLLGTNFSCQAEGCAIVARLDAGGSPSWMHVYDPGPGGYVNVSTLGVAVDGHLVLVGTLRGEIDFGAGPLGSTAGALSPIFAAALSPEGNGLWSRILLKSWASASVSRAGDIAVIGGSLDAVDFGDGPVSPPAGQIHPILFVASYNRLGELRFGRFLNGRAPGWPGTGTTAFDGAGNLLVVGDFGIDFGGDPHKFLGLTLAKLDPSGQHVWNTAVPGARPGHVPAEIAVAVDAANRIWVGGVDGALFQYSAAGALLATRLISVTGEAYGEMARIGPTGWPVVAGSFDGAVDLGQGALKGKDGQRIVFAAALGP